MSKTNESLLQRRQAAVPRGVGQIHPIVAERAENATVWDVEGREYIDFAGGIAVLNTGHLHPKVVAAVQEQLTKLTHTCFQVLAYEPLFRGTINSTSVYPRVVAQRVLELNAAAVVFSHQHPSGISEPSSADRMLTQQLQVALALIDVRVLDHIIVGQGAPFSFAESGLL